MLVIGAKGFAKEILQIFSQRGELENLFFFDNINKDLPEKLYDQFRILRHFDQVQSLFSEGDNRFIIGVGSPQIRFTLAKKFIEMGGRLTTLISPKADIGSFNTFIGTGSNIMTGAIIENDTTIGEGCLVNLNCTVSHDTQIGKYSELSPGVHVSGNCQIGDFCFLGTGCVILPKVKIGNNVLVGAGAVVTKNVSDGQMVVGVPAKSIK
jgi:sugar O-acyltransferase (sialic acid O-acetyltransferase NeuD family)